MLSNKPALLLSHQCAKYYLEYQTTSLVLTTHHEVKVYSNWKIFDMPFTQDISINNV